MPPIDHQHLAAQTGGDADLARELLALFAGQCRELLPRIVDPGLPLAERADLAHTLRGSALGIGAGTVATTSGTLEAAYRAGREADTAPLAEAVAAALRAPPSA